MNSPTWLTALGRIANGVMDAINRSNKKKAANDVANNLSNDGDVVLSDKLFTELPEQPKSDAKK